MDRLPQLGVAVAALSLLFGAGGCASNGAPPSAACGLVHAGSVAAVLGAPVTKSTDSSKDLNNPSQNVVECEWTARNSSSLRLTLQADSQGLARSWRPPAATGCTFTADHDRRTRICVPAPEWPHFGSASSLWHGLDAEFQIFGARHRPPQVVRAGLQRAIAEVQRHASADTLAHPKGSS